MVWLEFGRGVGLGREVNVCEWGIGGCTMRTMNPLGRKGRLVGMVDMFVGVELQWNAVVFVNVWMCLVLG